MTVRKDLYFAQIPEWVLYHDDIPPRAIVLYGILSRYAEGRCWPGRRRLAEQLRVANVKTVDRMLAVLADAGAVTITPRFDDAGDRTSNDYTVHVTPPDGVAARMSPPPSTDVATGGDKDVALTRETINHPPSPPVGARCSRPGAPHNNCRGCGTTARAAAARDADTAREAARLADLAAIEADRAHRLAAPKPTPALLDAARQSIRAGANR